MSNSYKKREDVPQEFKWSIEDMYYTEHKWEEDYIYCNKNLTMFEGFKNKLHTSIDTLYTCLKINDEINQKAEKVYVYAHMRFFEDSTNPTYQTQKNKAQVLITKLNAATSFINSEILAMDEKQIMKWLSENEILQVYKHFINNIFRQKQHIFTPELEELLANASELGNSPKDIFSMLNEADMKFGEVTDETGNKIQLTHSRFSSFLESNHKNVRKDAFETLYSSYDNVKNTLAATTYSNVKSDVFFANARKYATSLDASLFSHNIPVEVYTNLVNTVHEHLPLMHKYIQIRKKRLNLKELHIYDLYTPIVSDANTKINFEDAKKIVIDSLKPMGSEYVEVVREGFKKGWVDIYENVGKRSGAFCWGAFGGHPYVSLNYNDTISNMYTLAHEMGHAMHSYYSWGNQPYIYADYPIFLAEVASTTNEALLTDYLLKTTADKNAREYIINHNLDGFKGTLFRQTMFAEFELMTHNMVEKGEPLTLDILNEIYRALNQKYYGNDVIFPTLSDLEWARIPHFYNSFYVYQYATGYSAAMAFSQKILNEGTSSVENYKTFLKSGSSDYPINVLQKAGVDMTTPQPIKNALSIFEELLKEMDI